MILVNKGLIIKCYEKHRISQSAFETWVAEAERSTWNSFIDIKNRYSSADSISGSRVVINIKGNNYRLVIKVNYRMHIIEVRFAGTHAEYNKIKAETI